ncbi:Rpn family recombination-promoting nuclease/putative transposase [Sulfurihydrogenibium sp.]|uniref:Rpn family recombination-promoting nuclease/putative transposase n=1 Tax=Sulfurihydrogenibium sp. TaxID=2053621 RepID=UPI0026154177|nr:Rpn family recombination-promoting nuclease/putative transposase [Sulfurihydrogenibium sp.]
MSIEKHPHDWFFKTVFSNVKNTENFIKGFLPEIYSVIVPSSLKLISTEKQTTKKEKFLLDLSFECRLNIEDKNLDAIIYLVFEHKSYPDKKTPSQIAYYRASIMEEDERNNKPYRPVIPIVFYHGQKDWNIPTRIPDSKHYPDNIKDYITNLNYILIDLSKIENDTLIEKFYNDACLLSSILAFKNIFKDIKTLRPIFERLLIAENKDCIYIIIDYIVLVKKDLKSVEVMLEEIGGKEKMMTLTEKWKIEGLKQGLQEGLQQGLIKQAREDIFDAIEIKFGSVDEEIKKKVNEIESLDLLKNIHRLVIKSDSLEDVKSYIISNT